jgi:hypothetical protein
MAQRESNASLSSHAGYESEGLAYPTEDDASMGSRASFISINSEWSHLFVWVLFANFLQTPPL